jgi:prepilin-type N-terminal cleavage/methylation domain-containing protein
MKRQNTRLSEQGFTLLELSISVVIVGILSAIALPNFLNQVAKGRQADAITGLGTINRAQQSYRLEFGVFGTIGASGTLPVSVSSQYYLYSHNGTTPNATSATHYADVVRRFDDDLKDYSSSVGLTNAGVFSAIICEALEARMTAGVGNSTNGTTCGVNTVRVK